MDKERQNLLELTEFESINRDIIKRRNNGDINFNARIVFEVTETTIRETLNVSIHKTTWESGEISVEEGKYINSDNLHCRFIPRFQIYKCSEVGFLSITDTSHKVGKYVVTIIPC